SGAAPYTFSGSQIRGTSGGEIEMTSSVSSSQTFLPSLQIQSLGGTFMLSNDASSSAAIFNYAGQIAGIASSGSPVPATLVLAGANTANNTVSGNISDNGSEATSITKNGGGTWALTNLNSYSGATTVNAGTLELSGNGDFSSSTSRIAIDGGIFAIDNTANVITRHTGAGVSLNGGALNFISGSGGGGGAVNQVFAGNLDDAAGGVINLTPNNSSATILTATSLSRSNNEGTLFVTGTNLGAAPGPNTTNLVTTAAGSFAAPIGGGGAAGTNEVSIEAFAV